MKQYAPILFLYVLTLNSLFGQNHYQVSFFLLEDCKISQSYIPLMNELKAEFESDSIEFKAFFSNPTSEDALIKEFVETYHFHINCFLDKNQTMASLYHITVMPEVVVMNTSRNQNLYQGRIDNWFAKIGRRRAKATEHELEDCLVKIRNGQTVKPTKTKAIGCYLTRI